MYIQTSAASWKVFTLWMWMILYNIIRSQSW